MGGVPGAVLFVSIFFVLAIWLDRTLDKRLEKRYGREKVKKQDYDLK
jgi:hypothetical protein